MLPAQPAGLVDANLSFMGQSIMARVRKYERAGQVVQAKRAFVEGMRNVG